MKKTLIHLIRGVLLTGLVAVVISGCEVLDNLPVIGGVFDTSEDNGPASPVSLSVDGVALTTSGTYYNCHQASADPGFVDTTVQGVFASGSTSSASSGTVYITFDGLTAGTYDMTAFEGSFTYSFVGVDAQGNYVADYYFDNNTGTITVDSYGAVGEPVTGSLDIGVTTSLWGSGGTTHALTGTFSVTRGANNSSLVPGTTNCPLNL